MRLIDADKLNPDRMTNKGTVAISQSQIAKAPTVQAIPIEVLDKIRAEIEQKARPNELGGRGNGKSIRYGLCMALEIIDKYRAESENEE